MQWLNKVDDALDWVLGPVQLNDGEAAAAAAPGAAGSSGDTDTDDVDGAAISAAAAAAAIASVDTNAASTTIENHPPSSSANSRIMQGATAGGRREMNETAVLDANTKAKAQQRSRVPPPPPPPPYPAFPPSAHQHQHQHRTNTATSTPLPKTNERPTPNNNSTMLTLDNPDTCPSTPLVASMAGEYLVVDNESPYPSTFTATDVNMKENECEDGDDHCKPPDSIFAKEDDNEEEIIMEEASIREEAQFAIIQQQITTDKQQHQQQALLDDEFIAKNTKRQPPASSSASAVTEQTPLALQRKMQDYARYSPAPIKVTIGDRHHDHDDTITTSDGNLRISELSTDDNYGGLTTATELVVGKEKQMRRTPPPPPPILHDDNEQKNGTIIRPVTFQAPPTPSTFVIQLPTIQQQQQQEDEGNEPSPMKMPMVPPPPPPPPIGFGLNKPNSGNSLTLTPNPHRPHILYPQRLSSASAGVRGSHASRTGGGTNKRPITPGVIRSRLREPSPSPPDSPVEEEESYTQAVDIVSKLQQQQKPMSSAVVVPPPPFLPRVSDLEDHDIIDGEEEIGIEGKTVSILKPPPPIPDISSPEHARYESSLERTKGGNQDTMHTALPFASTDGAKKYDEGEKADREKANDSLGLLKLPIELNDEFDDNTKTDASSFSGGVKLAATSQTKPSMPPSPFQDGKTPVIDNRKQALPALNEVVDKANDAVDAVGKATSQIKSSMPPPPFQDGKTPVIDNRKQSLPSLNEVVDKANDAVDVVGKALEVVLGSGEPPVDDEVDTNKGLDRLKDAEKEVVSAQTDTVATFPPMNPLDMALGPVEPPDEKDTGDVSSEEVRNDAVDQAERTLNKVDKALDWILGPVQVKQPGDSTAKADNNDTAEEAHGIETSQSKEEPIAEAITGFFKRLGSTGTGKPEYEAKKRADDAEKQKDDGSMGDDSFHSQDSDLTDTDELDDFAIPVPTFDGLDEGERSWDPKLNQYGFFHVRLLRAQRLPCAPGSTIHATLSLQPWKGRIRIPACHTTMEGPDGAGVCLRWDKPHDQKLRGSTTRRGGLGSKDEGDSANGDPCTHAMVHAYNNEDTPVPTIVLELSISSLGASLGGVFDRFLCSVSIPCQGLMRNPRNWTQKWCLASLFQGHEADEKDVDMMENLPLVLLETCFEPKTTRFTVSPLSNQIILDQRELDDIETNEISEDTDTLGSIPHIIRPNRLQDDESSTLTSALIPNNTVSKSHLLRVRSFWTPTWCMTCGKNITTGLMLQGKNFECEACHIFCCLDCQLQVDVRIPCGSDLAVIAVKKAQQYQVPSISNIMTILAPYLEGGNPEEKKVDGAGEGKDLIARQSSLLQDGVKSIEGIGIMNIRVLRACLFHKTFPSEAEPNEVFKSDSNLRNGDHYVRVSWLGSKETKRTKTVLQTSKPLFDSEDMVFDVSHYGMEYKLEVVDANTDKPIGSCLLSAQGLLQLQRDEIIAKKDKLLLSLFHLRKYSEPRRIKLELRTGVKDGFGLNFYNSSKAIDGSNKGKETSRPGEISGWLELDVHLEEDRQLFYALEPRHCPPKTDEEFDIALIQLHIARIGELIEGIKKFVSTYMYVVSWKNRQVTGAALVIFVVHTLTFNMEYLGALPIGCLILYMLFLAYLRMNGHFKDRWTMKEKEALIKSETKIEKNQTIARPLGLLQVGDLQGKHLRSRELGLPGSFYASILYDPLRFADEKIKASLAKIDTACGTHEVGSTFSPGISSSPVWSHIQGSPELMRLKHLLPNDQLWRQEGHSDANLTYPILQPITDNGSFGPNKADNSQSVGVHLMPWENCLGAVVIQVKFSDVLGSIQMFDNVLGEVVIPLAKLAGSGRAVEGWFRLLDVGTKDTVPGETADENTAKSSLADEDTDSEEDDKAPLPEFPELYLKVKFSSNAAHSSVNSFTDDLESSKVICEELSRTVSLTQDNSIGVIGSSLNTINTVRTLGGKLQNQISVVVDMLERVRNAFNFSNPRITVFLLFALALLWIILALIPTRIVVILAGLGQFGATFYVEFVAKPTKKSIHKEKSDEGLESAKRGNPFENLFMSIPTDEDLRRVYFWEARRLGEKEREKFAVSKRQTRLDKLWKSKWHGTLQLKEKRSDQPASPAASSRSWGWEAAFALIEGHRFIYWRSEKHFDTGEAPLGQIYFAGHSGLAGLSPLDLRELSKEEIPFVVSIFGRGLQMQQKVTLLAPSPEAKDSLENAVLDASMNAKVD